MGIVSGVKAGAVLERKGMFRTQFLSKRCASSTGRPTFINFAPKDACEKVYYVPVSWYLVSLLQLHISNIWLAIGNRVIGGLYIE